MPTIPQTETLHHWIEQYRVNRRRIGSIAAIVFAVALTWHAVTGRNGLTSWHQKRADNQSLTHEIDLLSAENDRLNEHVNRLKSDPGAIEHEARSRLRYARPGEIIYTLPESEKK